MRNFYLVTLLICLLPAFVYGQNPEIEVLTSGTKTSLRGLSVVNDNVIWVSGSNGTVGRSLNAGKNWNWMKVNGFEKIEFRDIEGFDGNVAVIVGVGEPGYILKTNDGGQTWKVVYENRTKGMFLDAMDFTDNQKGMVIGDPIDGKVFMVTTTDSGNSWTEIETAPKTDSGEAFFAASGTNLRYFSNKEYFLVSGGMRSRLMTPEVTSPLPFLSQGTESSGANSIDIFEGSGTRTGQRIVVVGGDFANDSSRTGNCIYTINGGRTWKTSDIPPHGYRSCVEYLSKKNLIACGINGVDYSADGARTWKWISKEGFNVCRIAKIGTAIFLAGNNGKVGRIRWK